MDIKAMKKTVMKNEVAQNFLWHDGEGWTFPRDAQNFYPLSGGNTTKWGWSLYDSNHGNLFGSAATDFLQIAPFNGDGGTSSFTGGTFGQRLVPMNLNLFAVIGGNTFGWTDEDGTRQVIVDRVIGYGTGAATNFTLYVGTASVLSSSLTIKHTRLAVVNTGTEAAGTITGTNIASGTVNLTTGAITIAFTDAPDVDTAITVSYTVDSYLDLEKFETIGTGDGVTLAFPSLSTTLGLIRTRSVRIAATIGGITYYLVDDGAGVLNILGSGTVFTSGTVNYTTGAIALTFSTAPDTNTSIVLTYCRVGLNRSVVDYATGGSIALRFDAASVPDNATKMIMTASAYTTTEFAGNDVRTGILALGISGKKPGFRSTRSFLDTGSEDYADEKATIHSAPGNRHVVSFYGKTSSGTGKAYIRAWTGYNSNTQVSIGSTLGKEYEPLTGDFTRVQDPLDNSKYVLQCNITTVLTRFGAYVMTPANAFCLSLEIEGDTVATYLGEQSLWVSAISFCQGTQLSAYSPNTAVYAALLPSVLPLGRSGQVLSTDGEGRFTWVSIAAASGSGMTSLNGLSAAVQTLGIGTSGTAPAWVSTGSSHTLNIPSASDPTVTAGLISKTDYDKFNAASGGSNAFSMVPTSNDAFDIGSSSNAWRTTYTTELRASYLGDRTATEFTGGRTELRRYLAGASAIIFGYNSYNSNITGATRTDTNAPGWLLQADSNNFGINLTLGGVGATNSGSDVLAISGTGNLTIGRTGAAWNANRLGDNTLTVTHAITSDYSSNFASPAYDAVNYPLLTVRGKTTGTGKGPVIAFARNESATLPIAGIWAKTAASGSGLDKLSILAASNDTTWPTEVASIDKTGAGNFASLAVAGAGSFATLTVNGNSISAAPTSIPQNFKSIGNMNIYYGDGTNYITTIHPLIPRNTLQYIPAPFGSSLFHSSTYAGYQCIATKGNIFWGSGYAIPGGAVGVPFISHDGSKLGFLTLNGTSNSYYTTNYGNTWVTNTISEPTTAWGEVKMLYDGSLTLWRTSSPPQVQYTSNFTSISTLNFGGTAHVSGIGISKAVIADNSGSNVQIWNGSSWGSKTPAIQVNISGPNVLCINSANRYVYLNPSGYIYSSDDDLTSATLRYNTYVFDTLVMSTDGNWIAAYNTSDTIKKVVFSTDGANWTLLADRPATTGGAIHHAHLLANGGLYLVNDPASYGQAGLTYINLNFPSMGWSIPYAEDASLTKPTLRLSSDGTQAFIGYGGLLTYCSNVSSTPVWHHRMNPWIKDRIAYSATYEERSFTGSSNFSVLYAVGDRYTQGAFCSLWKSTDKAVSWQPIVTAGTSGVAKWNSVACSGDGTKVIATTGSTLGYIQYSTNSGATWASQTNAPSRTWYRAAMSSDGTYQAVAGGPGIWVSSNSGSTWVAHGTNTINAYDVCMSTTGKYMWTTAGYGSVDFGATWRDWGPGSGIALKDDIVVSETGLVLASQSLVSSPAYSGLSLTLGASGFDYVGAPADSNLFTCGFGVATNGILMVDGLGFVAYTTTATKTLRLFTTITGTNTY